MTLLSDPDCQAGKHTNCKGIGWDLDEDEPCGCPCTCHISTDEKGRQDEDGSSE